MPAALTLYLDDTNWQTQSLGMGGWTTKEWRFMSFWFEMNLYKYPKLVNQFFENHIGGETTNQRSDLAVNQMIYTHQNHHQHHQKWFIFHFWIDIPQKVV